MNYKITQADLIGEIANFPIEVVEKMIERQVEQGNVADVKVFQFSSTSTRFFDGFTWEDTEEGSEFWKQVICRGEFDVFFAKYPQKHYVYIYQDGTKDGSDVIETLKRRGGKDDGSVCGHGREAHYYIHPTTKLIKCAAEGNDILSWLKTFYTEIDIDVEPSIKEYTMQEIAYKLGIDVANLRIKK